MNKEIEKILKECSEMFRTLKYNTICISIQEESEDLKIRIDRELNKMESK